LGASGRSRVATMARDVAVSCWRIAGPAARRAGAPGRAPLRRRYRRRPCAGAPAPRRPAAASTCRYQVAADPAGPSLPQATATRRISDAVRTVSCASITQPRTRACVLPRALPPTGPSARPLPRRWCSTRRRSQRPPPPCGAA
jgi:hypothetical protein